MEIDIGVPGTHPNPFQTSSKTGAGVVLLDPLTGRDRRTASCLVGSVRLRSNALPSTAVAVRGCGFPRRSGRKRRGPRGSSPTVVSGRWHAQNVQVRWFRWTPHLSISVWGVPVTLKTIEKICPIHLILPTKSTTPGRLARVRSGMHLIPPWPVSARSSLPRREGRFWGWKVRRVVGCVTVRVWRLEDSVIMARLALGPHLPAKLCQKRQNIMWRNTADRRNNKAKARKYAKRAHSSETSRCLIPELFWFLFWSTTGMSGLH